MQFVVHVNSPYKIYYSSKIRSSRESSDTWSFGKAADYAKTVSNLAVNYKHYLVIAPSLVYRGAMLLVHANANVETNNSELGEMSLYEHQSM